VEIREIRGLIFLMRLACNNLNPEKTHPIKYQTIEVSLRP
jgi:hypothetical protein